MTFVLAPISKPEVVEFNLRKIREILHFSTATRGILTKRRRTRMDFLDPSLGVLWAAAISCIWYGAYRSYEFLNEVKQTAPQGRCGVEH